MTQHQLEQFNKKVNILFDLNRGLNLMEIQAKYKMSRQLARIYIKLAKNNYKIIKAAQMKLQYEENK